MQKSENLRSFRFKSINEHFWQELVDSTLYFCPPEELNDPFDCRIDVPRSLDRAIAQTSEKRKAILESLRNDNFWKRLRSGQQRLGVCCFARPLENPLMWAHYADAHKGVCLYYEIPATFIRERSGTDFVGWGEVKYTDDGLFEWLTTGDLNQPTQFDPTANTLVKWLTVKSEAWKYENEFRIVAHKPGSIEVEPSFLKQVCFGLETSPTYRKLIRDVAINRNPEVTFAAARKLRNQDTGLIVEEI